MEDWKRKEGRLEKERRKTGEGKKEDWKRKKEDQKRKMEKNQERRSEKG